MRNPFNETVKYFKKKAAKEILFYQADADDNTMYMSDGHVIAKMPSAFYREYIVPHVPGVPTWTGESFKVSGRNSILTDCKLDQKRFFEDSEPAGHTTAERILIEAGDTLTRCFFWDGENGLTGCPVNNDFYKMSLEYTNGIYFHGNERAPIITHHDRLSFLMLPMANIPAFTTLLDRINAGRLARTA